MLAIAITRGAALWVLLGAVLKLASGTPADLPLLIQDLPLGASLTFKLALGVELAVGVLAFVVPRRGVWLLGPLLLVFSAVLGWQLAQGAPACGCFGAALTVDPTLMLGIDLTWLGLLIALRPWRVPGGGGARAVLLGLVLAAAGAVLPWFLVHESQGPGDPGGYVTLEEKTWPGRRLDELPIAPWLGEHKAMQNGTLLIWRDSCPLCRNHLLDLQITFSGMDGSELLLLRLPEVEGDSQLPGTAEKPQGYFVHEIDLPRDTKWHVTPPLEAQVRDGVVVGVRLSDDFH